MKKHLFSLVLEYLACLEIASRYQRDGNDFEKYYRSERFHLFVEHKTKAEQTRRCMNLVGFTDAEIVAEIHNQKQMMKGER